MRLTDKCTIARNGRPIGQDPRPCELGHRSGITEIGSDGSLQVGDTARVIVGPDPQLVAVVVAGMEVKHHGRTYKVRAILPRYRPGGRLHHVSLELERWTGAG